MCFGWLSKLLTLVFCLYALVPRAGATGLCRNVFEHVATPLRAEQTRFEILGAHNAGDPVVFIHGVGSGLETFLPQATALAKTRKVILYDLRGHGRTLDPESGYDLTTLSEDLAVLLRSIGARRVLLIGHSAGGKIAMKFAARYPDEVSAVVIEDVGISELAPVSKSDLLENHERARRLRRLTENYASESDLAKAVLPLVDEDPARAAKLARKSFTIGTRLSGVIMDLWRHFEGTDNSDFVAHYPGPVLFLRAQPSTKYFTEADAQKIASAMPHAAIAEIPRTTHSIHVTTPEAWWQAVGSFLKGAP